MPKPDADKPHQLKPRAASKSASKTASRAAARTGANVIAMVPRQHAAPQNGAAAAAGFEAVPFPQVEWRRDRADTMRSRATIAVAGFLLGALACYLTLEYRAGRAVDISAAAAAAPHARAADPQRASP